MLNSLSCAFTSYAFLLIDMKDKFYTNEYHIVESVVTYTYTAK